MLSRLFIPRRADELIENRIFRARWIDVSKAGVGKPRWVCQDIAWEKKDDELFACTPSADSTRWLEAYAIYHGYRMMTADVSTTCLRAQENENVVIHRKNGLRLTIQICCGS